MRHLKFIFILYLIVSCKEEKKGEEVPPTTSLSKTDNSLPKSNSNKSESGTDTSTAQNDQFPAISTDGMCTSNGISLKGQLNSTTISVQNEVGAASYAGGGSDLLGAFFSMEWAFTTGKPKLEFKSKRVIQGIGVVGGYATLKLNVSTEIVLAYNCQTQSNPSTFEVVKYETGGDKFYRFKLDKLYSNATCTGDILNGNVIGCYLSKK